MTEFYKVCPLLDANLYVMPKPGKGGAPVAEDIAALKAEGIHTVVSLLEADELIAEGLEHEAQLCEESNLQYLNFPIEDHQVPDDRDAAMAFIHSLKDELNQGKNIAIHCRGGVGRTGTLAAALMFACDLQPEDIFERLHKARGKPMPTTDAQRAWVLGES